MTARRLWVWVGAKNDCLDLLRYVRATDADVLAHPAVVRLREQHADTLARVRYRAEDAERMVERLRSDFPPAPPLPELDCNCSACARLRRMAAAERQPGEMPTVREAARRRMPLDGADAQAMEHALAQAEALLPPPADPRRRRPTHASVEEDQT